MPKDMGMEWTVPQEIEKSKAWELKNSSDRLSGFTGISLGLLEEVSVLPESFTSDNLSAIWSPDQYEVISDIDGGEFSVEVKSKSDSNYAMRYVFDQEKHALFISNENLLMEDIHNHYDPKEENIAACQHLSQFGQILGLPPLGHAIQLEIQNHISVKTREELAASEKFLTRSDQRKVESAERIELAENIYYAVLKPMISEVNPGLANLDLDSNTFLDPEVRSKITKHSRMNTIGEISAILAKDADYFSSPSNIEYLREYLKNVAIGHNWFATDDIDTGRISNHHDFRQVFKVSDGSSLSAVIVDPNTRKYKEVGTGWQPDRPTYLLPIKDFGEQSLAFEGDIDDPSGPMEFRNEDEKDKYFDSVYQISDVAILQAIYDKEWEEIFEKTGRHPSGFGYNEVLVFSKVDFKKLTPDRSSIVNAI